MRRLTEAHTSHLPTAPATPRHQNLRAHLCHPSNTPPVELTTGSRARRRPSRTRVTIDGVTKRPSLNGRRGEIVGVDKSRYVVQLQPDGVGSPLAGSQVSLRFGAVAAC